jgi:hypothetical protein
MSLRWKGSAATFRAGPRRLQLILSNRLPRALVARARASRDATLAARCQRASEQREGRLDLEPILVGH